MMDKATPIQLMVPLEQIYKNPKNYKKHPLDQIARIAASYKRYGQRKPLVVKREEDHVVLAAGEGQLDAMFLLVERKEEGWEQWQQAWVTLVPDDWAQDQIEGYLIADNETNRGAEEDNNLLMTMLNRQYALGFDINSLGFSREMYEDMMAYMRPPTLEQLTTTFGDNPSDEDYWPTLHIKIAPADKERFERLLRLASGSNDTQRFTWLLDRLYAAMEIGEGVA